SFYQDAAVVAYRLPPDHRAESDTRAVVTSSVGPVNSARFSDQRLIGGVELPADGTGWLRFDYKRSQTIRAVTLGTPYIYDAIVHAPLMARVEALGPDGQYHTVATLNVEHSPQVTVSFKPVTAKTFKVWFLWNPAYRNLPELSAPLGMYADTIEPPSKTF